MPIMPIIPLQPIPGGGQQLAAGPGTVLMPNLGPLPTGAPGSPGPANPAAADPAPGPAPAPPRVTTKKTQTSLVTHQMSGPGPWPLHMLVPQGPKGELVPMRLVAVAHTAHARPVPGVKMSAALMAPPSAADLKKGKGCRAFIKPGEDPEVGDCFLEEYENGYNEEHSKKKFFGGGQTDSKREKQGARNSKRYKNESKYVRHPKGSKAKKQWLNTPDGAHHLVQAEVGPLFTAAPQKQPRPQRQRQRQRESSPAGPKAPNKVTVVRLPPGATAVTTVLRGHPAELAEQVDDDLHDAIDEDDDKALQQDEELDQSLDPKHREEDDGLVEVFKNSARGAARLTAPLVAVSPAKPMWVQEYHPVRIKQMQDDDDEFEVEESALAPVRVAVSPEARPALHPSQPRALDDMDLGWSSGFTDSVFDSDEPEEKQDMVDDANMGDFEHSMDDAGDAGDDHQEAAAQRADDGDFDGDEQDHAASEITNASHPILSKKGPAERMLQQNRRGKGPAASSAGQDEDADAPRLSAILAVTPPAPHPAAFGAKDPDRLESGRKAPVVLEFGHELSGYKVTREREQKKWRRRR
ncbi:hypothetical protein ONE63_002381 [Megalurothrips usitatus]|uniref:Uncharacterized protein n=1 Tax=Megalurothrips usitatus TaxID=439358 RepID=A0AAV7XEP5_9NEOP|nr:hypothetical protein ONE63_002381 [Megalurothrips usitatus]